MASQVDLVSVGGEGGNPFDLEGSAKGATLNKIWVYPGPWQIKAVRVFFTDGTRATYGQSTAAYSEFIFEDGERFVSLSLWPNKSGNRAGAIKFKTDRSREFYAAMEDKNLQPECRVDVGSGICVGVKGRSGADVDKLAFKFLKPIKSAKLMNVQYTTLNNVKPNMAVEEIDCMIYQNYTYEPYEFKVKASKPITRTSSWSFAKNNQYTVNMEVRAGAPELVEGPGGFSFKVGTESSYGLENNNNELFTLPLLVPPGKRMDVSVTIGRATVELPFTGTVQVTFSNGGVMESKINGTYKGVFYTNAKLVAKESA